MPQVLHDGLFHRSGRGGLPAGVVQEWLLPFRHRRENKTAWNTGRFRSIPPNGISGEVGRVLSLNVAPLFQLYGSYENDFEGQDGELSYRRRYPDRGGSHVLNGQGGQDN